MIDIKDEIREIHEDIEEIEISLNSIDKTLAVQAQELKDHIRRTELNEQAIVILSDSIRKLNEEEIRPLREKTIRIGVWVGMFTVVVQTIPIVLPIILKLISP